MKRTTPLLLLFIFIFFLSPYSINAKNKKSYSNEKSSQNEWQNHYSSHAHFYKKKRDSLKEIIYVEEEISERLQNNLLKILDPIFGEESVIVICNAEVTPVIENKGNRFHRRISVSIVIREEKSGKEAQVLLKRMRPLIESSIGFLPKRGDRLEMDVIPSVE